MLETEWCGPELLCLLLSVERSTVMLVGDVETAAAAAELSPSYQSTEVRVQTDSIPCGVRNDTRKIAKAALGQLTESVSRLSLQSLPRIEGIGDGRSRQKMSRGENVVVFVGRNAVRCRKCAKGRQ